MSADLTARIRDILKSPSDDPLDNMICQAFRLGFRCGYRQAKDEIDAAYLRGIETGVAETVHSYERILSAPEKRKVEETKNTYDTGIMVGERNEYGK